MDEEVLLVAQQVVETSITELIEQSSVILSDEELEVQRIKVENCAKRFLDQYAMYELMKKKVSNSVSGIEAVIDKQKELKYVYQAFFNFQNELNIYFKQRVKVLFVFHGESGTPQIAIFDNDVSHLGVSSYGALMYQLTEITTILNEKDYDPTRLNETEREIQYRWSVAKEKIKKSRYLPILWKINGQWAGAKVNNLGTIAEAYAKFYVNHFEDFTSDKEINVSIFITHTKYGTASVDNASGLLIGDIDNISGLNLAVKKESASPMSMTKVRDIVQSILNEGPFDPNKMKTAFVDKVQTKAIKGQMQLLTTNELAKMRDEIIAPLEKFAKS